MSTPTNQTIIAEHGQTYWTKDTLYVQNCCTCGILFGIPNDFDDRRRQDGRSFYCPNGHSLSYSDTLEKQLKREVERLEQSNRWREDQLRAARKDADHQRRVAAAAKGRVTKIKNRIANGVCPAPGCKRSGLGSDVVAHIAACHPDFHGHE
jgi:hypothetical protein